MIVYTLAGKDSVSRRGGSQVALERKARVTLKTGFQGHIGKNQVKLQSEEKGKRHIKDMCAYMHTCIAFNNTTLPDSRQ